MARNFFLGSPAESWLGISSRIVLAGVTSMVAMTRTSASATQNPPTPQPVNAKAWVHPVDGTLPEATGIDAKDYINDPSLKFATLQSAIDAMQEYLIAHYDSVSNPDQQGIVIAMPGEYGPGAVTPTGGDVLPILMRDRVHVQGVGARRCVVRGASTLQNPVPNSSVRWPTLPAQGPTQSVEVLVSYAESTPDALTPNSAYVPWFDGQAPFHQIEDTPEVLDGFSLQGGDVQVLMQNPPSGANYFPAARISNCIFDLRHLAIRSTPDPASMLTGPYFGVMMMRPATYDSAAPNPPVGYLDGRTLIAHNTFAFARWHDVPGDNDWQSESRPSAVGIIDFTAPICTTIPDPDDRHRGVGNPCIVSNVFRTRPIDSPPPAVRPFAMLGVGDEDMRVLNGGSYVQSNAFDPARVGSTNGYFWSVPVSSFIVSAPGSGWVHWNCQVTIYPGGGCGSLTPGCGANPPTQPPAVHIWDGTSGVDPAFVGEYVATQLSTTQNPLADDCDWRIMPESPLENLGVAPTPGSPRGFTTAPHAGDPNWLFPTADPVETNLFTWDGEHWGNPRISDGAPDLGFDERGLLICAGNWANDTNSHNQPGFMHPSGVGSSTRYFILPTNAGGVTLNVANRYLRIHDTTVTPVAPNTGDGWINPPGALANPANLGTLPQYYRTKYISHATVPWAPISLQGNNLSWPPLGGTTGQNAVKFLLRSTLDDECAPTPCTHSYFNLQAAIVDDANWPTTTVEVLRSNMQGEYR